VFISGATGPNAAAINGYFAPTQEKGSDGRFVLSKSGDASMCIEHFGGKWQLKPVSSKGTAACTAYVAGDCALQDCTSRVWKVDDGIPENPLVDQASVKMATGSEAEQKVCGGCTRAHQHHAPAPHPHARILPCDALRFLHRVLNMLQLRHLLPLTTTRVLPPCSSAAPQAPMLPQSTVISLLRRRRVWTAVLC